MKKVLVVFVLISALFSGYFYYYSGFKKPQLPLVNQTDAKEALQVLGASNKARGETGIENNRRLRAAEKVPKQIYNYLANEDQTILDVENIGADYTYVQTYDELCPSCQINRVYVFDSRNKMIYSTNIAQGGLEKVDGTSFTIKEPIISSYTTRKFGLRNEKFEEIK